MLDFLLSPAVGPFSVAQGLPAGLLVLDIVALVMGGSVFSNAGEDAGGGGGIDKGAAVDPVNLPIKLDISHIDTGDINAADLDLGNFGSDPAAPVQAGGLAGMLGLGKVPFLIWLAALLAGLGLSGYVRQSVTLTVLGAPLPVAILPATVAGLWFARTYGAVLARLIPKTESSVSSDAMLNRRGGVVSQGVACRDSPAEVRVQDAHGNMHFIRAEPLDCTDAIPAGTDVLVLRVRLGPEHGKFRVLALGQS